MKKALIIFLIVSTGLSLLAATPDTLSVVQGKMKSPALSLGLSAVMPGGGQFYNQKWVKGGIFMTAELALGGIAAYHYYNHAQGIDQTLFGEGEPLSTAKQFTWFFAAVYAYSLMDAYVDAHLSNFPNERLILEPDPGINGIQLSFQF